jgi:hypothetical protein
VRGSVLHGDGRMSRQETLGRGQCRLQPLPHPRCPQATDVVETSFNPASSCSPSPSHNRRSPGSNTPTGHNTADLDQPGIRARGQPRDQASYSLCFTTSPARRLCQFRYRTGSHWRRRSSPPIKTTATPLAATPLRRVPLPAAVQREPLDIRTIQPRAGDRRGR